MATTGEPTRTSESSIGRARPYPSSASAYAQQVGTPPGLHDNTTDAKTHLLRYLYAEYIEEEICRSAELIQAKNAVHGTPTVPTWEELTDGHALERLLSALAFNLHAQDCWTVLGLGRLEGPKPSRQMLASRRDVGLKLLGAIPTQQLSAMASDTIQTHKDKLTGACSACSEELDKVLRERGRKMLKGEDARNVPRWFEPSSDLISHFRG